MNIEMDFTPYTSFHAEMEKNPSLCNLFQLLATETWKRLEFSFKHLKKDVHEPTITQNLVFNINAFAQKYGFNIIFEESTNEATNGNDLELVLYYDDSEYVFYAPIQAKRVKSNGEYKSFPYKDQILKLIAYAQKWNGFPLYLFYNYSDLNPTQKTSLLSFTDCHDKIDETQYGCTIASAEYLKTTYVTCTTTSGVTKCVTNSGSNLTFFDIHPNESFPWNILVCCSEEQNPQLLSEKLSKKRKKKGKSEVITEKFISNKVLPGVIKKSALPKEGWRKFSAELSQKENIIREVKSWRSNPDEFSPRFRMSFTINNYVIDTILVHASPESYEIFEKSQKNWSEIAIAKWRINNLKHIAFYVSSPEKKIVSVASIESISPSKTSDKYVIYVKDLKQLENPIPYDGSKRKSIGRVYISKKKLENSKTWSQLFETDKK
ncbi:MAG: hypothetical protein JST26_09795 [Bacteroidetes bacterium]|nr:hypothetical protein [Bacteroidota bacterium]